MRISTFWGVIGAVFCLFPLARADTLTFVPAQAPAGDFNWFNSANWFSSDAEGNLSPAGRLPLGDEQAVVTGFVDAGSGGGIRLQNLLATNNAIIANGRFALLNLQMLSGSSFSNSMVNLLTSMTVAGTNCSLNGTALSVFNTASAIFAPIAPAPAATLVLAQGSRFQNGGSVNLTDGSLITGGNGTQSQFVVLSGAVLTSTNQTFFQAPAGNPLIIDHNGLIRVTGGTLRFGDGLAWQSSSGGGEFQASATNALVLFASPFHIDTGVIDLFTGSGTNRWLAGAGIDGTAQVVGNLEVLDTVSGGGNVRVLNTGSSPGVMTWINGIFSLPQVSTDSGGNLLLAGGAGTARQLVGCAINNSGYCGLLKGDLSFSQNASLNNLPGALLDLVGNGALLSSSGSPAGAINNSGTLRKSTPGIAQIGGTGLSGGPDLNNSGLLDLQGGQLNIQGGVSSGEFRTAAGATLWFWGGTHTLNAVTTFTGAGSVVLRQGTGPAKWVVNAPMNVADLEISSNGMIDASGNASATPIHFTSLETSENGTLSNGKYEAQHCQILDRSILTNSLLTILGDLSVTGTNCNLNSATLNIPASASATIDSSNPASIANLKLGQGSAVQLSGTLRLANGANILAGEIPQNQLLISPAAVLSSTNFAAIQGVLTNSLRIDNNGTMRADAGALQLGPGIEWKSSLGGGEFQAAAPTSLLMFTTPFHVEPGVIHRFTGAGTNRWAAGGIVEGTAQVGAVEPFSQTAIGGNLELLDSVTGAGSIQVTGSPSQAGLLSWFNGTLGLAQINISNTGSMLISGGSGTTRQWSGARLNNSGQCVWRGGVTAGAGATFANLAGAILDLQGDTALVFDNAPPMLALNNAGTFIKSSGNGLTSFAGDFKNTGTFELQAGTLGFQGYWVQNEGNSVIDGGATLTANTMSILGGRVSGNGTINALVNNAAVTSPGLTTGILTIGSGKDYQQTPLGTLAVQIAGHTPGTQYDRLLVGGQASLAGRLQVSLSNGFVPQPGDSFEVLTCASETGAFSRIDPTGIPGTFWLPRYQGTNVLLVLANTSVVSPPSVSGGSVSISFQTTIGLSYLVEFSNTLTPPNWQLSKILAGDGKTQTITDSATQTERFYRVSIQ